ncbi:alpha/beta fold hydrolase [Thermogemmatispora onikobensis]|uniref:alpha/beta fold hydrolase n=1 Tax=Thermogemmatispora onikobensis TaxID=732234 RepID=UPI000853DFAF|nr:alpha/beta fold hydrolase [Thermogemmatispora onikobensis]
MAKKEEQEALLTTRDGIALSVHSWKTEQPNCLLLCIQGLGGHGGYYDVLAQAPELATVQIVAPDLRGHGRSQGRRGDIASFRLYLEDVDSTIAWVRRCWPFLPLILLGESMGSSIAIHYLSSHLPHVQEVSGLILISPVLSASITPRPGEVLRYLRLLLTAPTRPAMPITGREELGCRDPAFNERLRQDPLFVRLVSVRFLNLLSSWLASARRRAPAIHLPLLLLRGSCDFIARERGTRAFLRRIGSRDVEVVTLTGAYHSLLHDPATPALLEAIHSWIERHLPQTRGLSTAQADRPAGRQVDRND